MSCLPVLRRPTPTSLALAISLTCLCACATSKGGAVGAEPPDGPNAGSTAGPTAGGGDPASVDAGAPLDWIATAEQALHDEQPARAAALFSRALTHEAEAGDDGEIRRRAYLGLARAHEQLGDFEAAIRAYDGFLAGFADDPEAPQVVASRGACEAELGSWERSAASFARVLELGGDDLLPSQRVEALARQGFALFQLGRYEQADALFAEADERYSTANDGGEERFSDTYFVAMARFYRAAIIHIQFREVAIRLPEAQMSKDFERKLELLEQAQDAYNRVVQAKHVYWVSAAGYQLGSLFEEFYDAVMHAPVPDWLDENQRRTYYAELEEQLRPVVEKAVWVFEKNLETARKFGYDNQFVEQTQARLAQLQAIMLGRDGDGGPVPRLAPPGAGGGHDGEAGSPDPEAQLPAVERKLFVPMPTTL